jgi:hypothetical protein
MVNAPRQAKIVPSNDRAARPLWGPLFLGYHGTLASFHEAFHI